MSFLTEHKQKFDDLRAALHEDNRTQLKRSANGGNTVLFVYPPAEEEEYIEKAKQLYPDGRFIVSVHPLTPATARGPIPGADG